MGSLATSPTLVMRQITSVTRCDFDILDGGDGTVVGAVTTQGSVAARMFTGPRQLTVTDADGTPFVHVDDVPNIGLDRYDLYGPSGDRIGRVTKEFTLFRKRLTVEHAGGTFELTETDFMDRDFELGPGGRLATVRRSWPGILEGLLSRSTYVVAFGPNEPPGARQAALGAVIAVELVRLKARRNNAAT